MGTGVANAYLERLYYTVSLMKVNLISKANNSEKLICFPVGYIYTLGHVVNTRHNACHQLMHAAAHYIITYTYPAIYIIIIIDTYIFVHCHGNCKLLANM